MAEAFANLPRLNTVTLRHLALMMKVAESEHVNKDGLCAAVRTVMLNYHMGSGDKGKDKGNDEGKDKDEGDKGDAGGGSGDEEPEEPDEQEPVGNSVSSFQFRFRSD